MRKQKTCLLVRTEDMSWNSGSTSSSSAVGCPLLFKRQEDVSSCSTRRRVFLLDETTCPCSKRRPASCSTRRHVSSFARGHVLWHSQKACGIVRRETSVLVQKKEDVSSCLAGRHLLSFGQKTCFRSTGKHVFLCTRDGIEPARGAA